MIECYHCEAENKNDANYCSACGKPVCRTCDQCDREVGNDDTFCDSCGEKLS